MTLIVDAARAAFNSSTTTISVKRLKPRFWPPFCDWEPHYKIACLRSFFSYQFIFYAYILTHIFFSYTIQTLHGDIAQLVEHTAHIRDVIGPIPIIPTPIRSCSISEQDFFIYD